MSDLGPKIDPLTAMAGPDMSGAGLRLGPAWIGGGVLFSLVSVNADMVELCLFDGGDEHRLPLSRTGDVWTVAVANLEPGRLYGYRVHGAYQPAAGHRFNPNKLLLDPYATELAGTIVWDDALYGYDRGSSDGDLSFDGRDSAPFMPRCVVPPRPTAEASRPARPARPLSETVIYEAHLRGLTILHPDIPERIRGTYEALGHPAIVRHLQRLGVTAVELLPIHAYSADDFLVRKGLANYWGYSTLGFFAPHPPYAGPAGAEGLKTAIDRLHEAGIEVILDVVYNHTAEASEVGPTFSFRGIDNASYYKLRPDDPRRCFDVTATGNTLDVSRPHVTRLVLDSLRHWAEEYKVDGFRFDLAATLGRNPIAFDPQASLFSALAADPAFRDVKLIAEPWDPGENGYQLGRFPTGWSEWNDRFREGVQAFWRGESGQVPVLSHVMAGTSGVFGPTGRGPAASINYVVSHDGFTLADLVSYEHKRNEANGENNRDGNDHVLSNCGVEGPTEDPAIRSARTRLKRNLLASVFLAQGVPMIQMGDERGRSQGGNNNAYCQDNRTTWMDWSDLPDPDDDLSSFIADLAALRQACPELRREHFLTGEAGPGGVKDVSWLLPDGRELGPADWADTGHRAFGMLLADTDRTAHALLILFNAGGSDLPFRLPAGGASWIQTLSTGDPAAAAEAGTFNLEARSVVLFRNMNASSRGVWGVGTSCRSGPS